MEQEKTFIKIGRFKFKRIHIERAIQVKIIVFGGMIITCFVPLEYAAAASMAVNSIWLWKL